MDKKDLSRGESMEFRPTEGGGLIDIRTSNGISASEWNILGEDAEVANSLRAKGEGKVVTSRQENLRFKGMLDGTIRGYRSDRPDKSTASEYQLLTDKTESAKTLSTAGHQKLYNGARIRKLTEREAFRLMGVNDSDIDKIQAAGISGSQQYKMAGNSIVVDVLANIFRTLLIDTEPPEGTQLTLF